MEKTNVRPEPKQYSDISRKKIFNQSFRIFYFLLLLFVLTFEASSQRINKILPGAGLWSVSAEGGGTIPANDFTKDRQDYLVQPVAWTSVGYNFTRDIKLIFSFSGGRIYSGKHYPKSRTNYLTEEIRTQFRFEISNRFVPFFDAAFGGIYFQSEVLTPEGKTTDIPHLTKIYSVGFGVEYFFRQNMCIHFRIAGVVSRSDKLDGLKAGYQNDGYGLFLFGFTKYFTL